MENLKTLLHQLQLADRHSQHQEKRVLIEDAKVVLSAFHIVEEYDTHTLDMIGTLFVIVGNWEKQHENLEDAMKCFENAKICFTACSNKEGLAKVKASIADIHASRNNSHLAITLLMEAKQEFEDLQMKKETATSLGNIAVNYARLSDFTTAIKHWMYAIPLHEKINDVSGLARTYSNLGAMYTYLEKYEEAITSHLQAINLYQSINNTQELTKPFSRLASVYYFTGNYELALEYYQMSLSIAQDLGLKTEHANSYINIGNVYIKLNEFEQGIEFITKAISILESTDSLQSLGVAYGDLADAYGSTEYSGYNSVHAEELYKKSIGVLESIQDKKNSLIYHKKLAELYENT
ncbi:MAG: tetratricopeptide repeat protein, partial [Candidatus Kapabacteria bacterium]|nr:tetratricopeptide repeat protein [Candidatus Kapabacteria bacterium]